MLLEVKIEVSLVWGRVVGVEREASGTLRMFYFLI